MGLDWRHGLRLDSRLRAYAWPVFFASLVVDIVLFALFRDYTSSVGAAQLLEPALTIAVLGVALFAGPLFGLTAALFMGTVFYCFLASLPGHPTPWRWVRLPTGGGGGLRRSNGRWGARWSSPCP
jgi:hypothetical protein